MRAVEDTPPHIIAVENGILDLKTKELSKFSPKYFILNTLPVKYDPKKKCPKILTFLSEVLYEDDISIIQELAGYCLYREYPIHKGIMLIGEGANGKSTFMEVLRTMLNNDNVSTEPLQAFETNRFSMVSLYGKLANIYPDLSDSSLKATGLFKMLTGGDTITAEYKYRDRFCFKNYAKLIFSANKIPESPDDSAAFFRRWIIINFPNQFLPENPKTDPNLLKKLTTPDEISGFFNWALEGLERLLKNGKFSNAKSIEDTRMQYIRSSDPVKAFVMDMLDFDSNVFIPKETVYKAFIKYCFEMKLPTVSKRTFENKLVENSPSIQTVRRDVKSKRQVCWLGIAMKGNATNATKTTLFTTVSILDSKENTKNTQKSNSGKNGGFRGVDGVKEVEDFENVVKR